MWIPVFRSKKRFKNLCIGFGDIEQTNILTFFLKHPVDFKQSISLSVTFINVTNFCRKLSRQLESDLMESRINGLQSCNFNTSIVGCNEITLSALSKWPDSCPHSAGVFDTFHRKTKSNLFSLLINLSRLSWKLEKFHWFLENLLDSHGNYLCWDECEIYMAIVFRGGFFYTYMCSAWKGFIPRL